MIQIFIGASLYSWDFWEKPVQGAMQYVLVGIIAAIAAFLSKPLLRFVKDRDRRTRFFFRSIEWTLDIGSYFLVKWLADVAKESHDNFVRSNCVHLIVAVFFARVLIHGVKTPPFLESFWKYITNRTVIAQMITVSALQAVIITAIRI